MTSWLMRVVRSTPNFCQRRPEVRICHRSDLNPAPLLQLPHQLKVFHDRQVGEALPVRGTLWQSERWPESP